MIRLDKTPMLSGTLGSQIGTALTGQYCMMPVQSVGMPSGSPEYFVDDGPSFYSGIRIWQMNSSGQLTLTSALSATYTPIYQMGATAPQAGTTATLDTLDSRLITAVYRNNSIWTAHTVNISGHTAIQWYQISTSGGNYSIAQQGDINSGTGIYTFSPAIAVDSYGDMALTYTQSSANQYPAMMLTARAASDPAGTTTPGVVVEASPTYFSGETAYGSSTIRRWGDYAGIASDPNGMPSFWPFAEYAHDSSYWGTWGGEYALLSSFPSPTASATSSTPTTASLAVSDSYGDADSILTYTWNAVAKPSGAAAPIYSPNGTSSAKNTTATLYAAGSYAFQVTISNGQGFSTTASVSITVNQSATSVTISPASATVADGNTQSFSASVKDQFGAAISSPSLTWSVNTGGVGGTINQSGLYTAPSSGSGTDTVKVVSGAASATATVTVTSSTQNSIAIDCGSSSSVGSFIADGDYSGGSTYSVSSSIDTSGVSNPPPQAVFQTQRFGNFTYTIPNLTPKTAYNVRLDFAEIYWTGPNQRIFNVAINGVPVLTNFDAYAAANGMNKAVAETFAAAANSQGQIAIQFTAVKDNAMVEGIEISPATDLALNRPAQASSVEDGSLYPVSKAVDGNSSTRWSSGQWTQPNSIGWIYVDLGANEQVNVVRLNWQAAYAVNFQIQVSQDASTWTDLENVQGNSSSGVQVYSGLAGYGRYVRVFCTQVNGTNNYSLYDLNVYGVAAPDLALGKPAQASSVEDGSLYPASKAVDGNSSTRWSSGQWAQSGAEGWIYVDLGALYNINEVKLNWQAAYAVNYTIQVSFDTSASSWETIKTVVNNGSSGWLDYQNLSGTGRYLRIDCTQENGTSNYSLWDLNVFGTPATDLALNKPTARSSVESSSYESSQAVDGNSATRWSSGQWQLSPPTQIAYIYVDLGASYEIQEVRLNWETAYAVNYAIQASNNPSQGWTTLANITGNNRSGIFDFPKLEPAEPNNSAQAPIAYRYVQIYCTQVSGGADNYSLYDFNVFGSPSNSSNPAFMVVVGGSPRPGPGPKPVGPLPITRPSSPSGAAPLGRSVGSSDPSRVPLGVIPPSNGGVVVGSTGSPTAGPTGFGAAALDPSVLSGPFLTPSDLDRVFDELVSGKMKTGILARRGLLSTE